MGLARKGPQAHASGAKAAADALHALHLFDRQRRGRGLEFQQVPQGRDWPVLKQGFVGGEVVVAGARLDGGMQGFGHLRAIEVILAASAVLHEAHELELGAVELGEGLGMEAEGFAGQLAQAQASHPAGGATEGKLDQIGAKADGFEDLGAVIAGQQGDADLGEDLAQAVF